MVILGVHGGEQFADDDGAPGFSFHDAAAVLLRDGEVVAAIEEERLCRVKHANSFPIEAIGFCLNQLGIGPTDVDRIAINLSKPFVAVLERTALLQDATTATPLNGDRRYADLFRRAFQVDVTDKLRFCHHHLAHAWSAFVPSGFDHSLILSIDGNGEFASGMVLVGERDRMVKVKEFSLAQSLGNLYAQLIAMLGYSRFDEYKVMGLAPYGDPTSYRSLFDGLYQLLPDGDYRLKQPTEWFADLHASGLLDRARRKGEPFSQMHKDFAAGLQQMLERIVLHVLQHYRRVTNAEHLSIAGGVAHNCTLNGKILSSGLFKRVFVQPAAHDAGGALGAAWWAYYEATASRRRPTLPHLYFGTDIGSASDAGAALARWRGLVEVEKCDDIAARTAALLAGGAVVGWVQGRSEFGPRALGNRSILADPRPADHKRSINEMVKKREGYRPFAPSVLAERAAEYFELPSQQTDLPFMIFVVGVQASKRELLGAVTHVDGTARVHTVSRETHPRYWRLISEFERLTGVPVVLNTSFNNNAEPIVDSIDDAVACFLTTGITHLVVGDFLVNRSASAPAARTLLALAPALPRFKKLVKRRQLDVNGKARWSFAIESAMSRHFGPVSAEISETLFQLLLRADGTASVRQLAEDSDRPRLAADDECLAAEILDLWSRRLIAMSPAAAAGAGVQSVVRETVGVGA